MIYYYFLINKPKNMYIYVKIFYILYILYIGGLLQLKEKERKIYLTGNPQITFLK